MFNRSIKVSLFLLCFGLLACQAGSGPAVTPNAAPSPAASTAPNGLPGGYFEQNPTDPAMQDILKQAEKLLQAKYPAAGIKLTKLNKISSQVVAGTNFSLEAGYTDNKGSGNVQMVVFRSLQGDFSLTSDNYAK